MPAHGIYCHFGLCIKIGILILSWICIKNCDGQACPGTWEQFGNYCYMYFGDQIVNWAKAEYLCQQYVDNGHLVSLHSAEEVEFISEMINNSNTHWQHDNHWHHNVFHNEFIWLGMSTMCPDKGKRWTDGSSVNFDLMKDVNGQEKYYKKCAGYFIQKEWYNQICTQLAPYICKAPANGTKEARLDKNDDVCGDWNWCYYNDKCYKMDTTPKIWLDARQSCLDSGSDLVSVHSNDELQYLGQKLLIDWDPGQSFWSGLNKFESMDDRFRWADNSPLDYVPLMTIEYNEWRHASCVLIKPPSGEIKQPQINEQLWKLDRCDAKHMSLCVKYARNYTAPPTVTAQPQNQPYLSSVTPGYCKDGWVRYGGRCYKAFGVKNVEDRTNFFNASTVCYIEGSQLTSIKDVYENFFVLSLLHPSEVSWLGLIYQESRLQWLDETKVSFVSFDTSSLATYAFDREKNNDNILQIESNVYSFSWQRRCFTMYVNKSPGIWEPVRTMKDFDSLVIKRRQRIGRSPSIKRSFTSYVNWRHQLTDEKLCERESYSFVCEYTVNSKKLKNSIDEITSTKCGNDTESEKSFRFRNNCYHFIILPKSWETAEQLCQMRSSDEPNKHLVSINSVYEFGFVVSMAQSIGLSQFWIGLSDKTDLGTFAWSDDWPDTFSQWGPGEPRRSDQDRCVKMQLNSENGGKWFTTNCDVMLPYVCKSTAEMPPPSDVKNGTCPPNWFTGSSQCYRVIADDWTSGANAVLRCWREHNATLASFHNKDDIDRIIERPEVLHAKRRFFIGLVQKLHGGYEWLTGDPLSFVNWAPQEPRYAWNANVEVCVEMDYNGMWYDVGCYETRHFICSMPKTSVEPKIESTTTITTTSTSTEETSESVESETFSYFSTKTNKFVTNNNNNEKFGQKQLSNGMLQQKKSQPDARPVNKGAAFGIGVSVSFLLACVLVLAFYVYKRRTKMFKCFRQSDVSMRFEILNEIDDT